MRAQIRILGLFMMLSGIGVSEPMPVVECPCDHVEPSSMQPRVCSLCKTAQKHSGPVYFLKDINPRKPNRHLALPTAHERGSQSTSSLTPELRAQLWKGAIEHGEELFPGRWGVAENSHFFRTQCHAHLHIGPLSPEIEDTGALCTNRLRTFQIWRRGAACGFIPRPASTAFTLIAILPRLCWCIDLRSGG